MERRAVVLLRQSGLAPSRMFRPAAGLIASQSIPGLTWRQFFDLSNSDFNGAHVGTLPGTHSAVNDLIDMPGTVRN